LIVTGGNKTEAERLLETVKFQVDRIEEEDLGIYAGLFSLAGRAKELDDLLERILTMALVRGEPSRELEKIAPIFFRLGRWQEFEKMVRQSLGSEGRGFVEYLRTPLARQVPRTR